MMYPPGSGVDLDRAVADALVNGKPNTRLQSPIYTDISDSLLMLVAVNRRTDLTEVLLKAGATISINEFCEVLYWWPDTEMVSLFLKSGIPHNTDCVEMAIRKRQWDIVEVLLDYGADVDGIYDATFLLHIAVRMGEQSFLESLLCRGADVHRRYPGGRTPLMKACEFRNEYHNATPRIVETLLQKGADPNMVTAEGESALLLCTVEKLPFLPQRVEIARILLRYGADPNLALPSGMTPLMFAARDNNLLLATALAEAGASAQIATADGQTALDVARQYKSGDVLAFLKPYLA